MLWPVLFRFRTGKGAFRGSAVSRLPPRLSLQRGFCISTVSPHQRCTDNASRSSFVYSMQRAGGNETHGNASSHASDGVHAAATFSCPAVSASLCLERREPVGTTVERRNSRR